MHTGKVVLLIMKKHLIRTGAVVLAAIVGTTAVSAAVSGDLDGSGNRDLNDVTMLCNALARVTELSADADLDGNGVIDARDLTLLKRAVITPEEPPVVTPPAGYDFYVRSVTYSDSGVTLKNAAGETVDASDAENVRTDGTYVTIIRPTSDPNADYGDINVDGSCGKGQLCVDVDKTAYPDAQVTVNLRGLTLTNAEDSPIYVASVDDEFVLTVKKETENTITDGADYTNADGKAGAIYACDDMKIKGTGKLTVNGKAADGIVCKDDLKLWNGSITVNAKDDGIRGKDSIRIGDPESEDFSTLNISIQTEAGDGLKSTSTNEGKGFIRVNGGTVGIEAYADGIQAEQSVEINGGEITIYTYQGSGYSAGTTGMGGGMGRGMGMDGNSNKVENSAKGIKAVGLYDEAGTTWQSGGDITIKGGTIIVDSSDDAVHCGGSMVITGGDFKLATADDALHSDHDLTLGTKDGAYSDFGIYVTKCYEGVEGQNIYQYSGTVFVKSDDDGYNAAGGSDGSGNQNPGGFFPGGGGFPGGGFGGGGGDYALTIEGGIAIVQSASGDHDAFDSNGSLTVSGGIVIANGNEPLDSDGTNSVTGGTVVTVSQASSIAAGVQFTVADGTGKVIVSFKTMQAMGSCTLKHSDGTVNLYTGGTVTGGTDLIRIDDSQPLYADGAITGGTTVTAGSGGGQTNPWSPWG